MRPTAYLAMALMPVTLAACSGPGGMTKQDTGTAIGAVAGGLLGNTVGKGSGRVAATAVGAVVGGIIGNQVGASLDEADRRAAAEAEYRALEYGRSNQPTPWRNPDSGHYGNIVPGAPYKVGETHCREYTHTIYIDGRPETVRGRACRAADGTWRAAG